MFAWFKNLFRKKKVEEVKKVEPVVTDLHKAYETVKDLRPTLVNSRGHLSVEGLTPKPAPKAPPRSYGSESPSRSTTTPYQYSPVMGDIPDTPKDSFLTGMVTGVAVDEVFHAVSKSVETSHHTPPPEPVHVTPSSSSSDYSSSSSSSSSFSDYSSSSRSDSSWGSSSSSDYSSSSSDSGSSWSD